MITVIDLIILLMAYIFSIAFNGAGDGIKQRRVQTNSLGAIYHIYWIFFIGFLLLAGIAYPKVQEVVSLESLFIMLKLLLIYAMLRFGLFSPIRNLYNNTSEHPVHLLYIGETAWQDKLLTKLFGWNNFMKSVLFGVRWVTFFGAIALAKYFFL